MTNRNAYQRQWRKEHPKYAEYQKQWYKEHLESYKLAQKKYRQTEKYKLTRQKYNQTEKHKLGAKKYRQTEKGKIKDNKQQARRKRNLNWIQMFENPFDESELIDWHHITDAYVVAIPRDLHQLYYGEYHREKIMEIVKQVYLWLQ